MTGNGAGAAPAGGGPAGGGRTGGGPAATGPPPTLLAGLGAACISASAVLIKLAGTGTATAAFYRCLLALPVLVALAVLEQRRRGSRAWRARLGAVVAGVFLAIDLVLWNHAIADVGAGIATVLGNLQVVFVTAAAWVAFRERPARGFFLALPVVLAGVVLVSGLADGAHGVHSLAGIEYGLGTSVAYAVFLLVLRQTSAATPHVAGPLAEATLGAAAGAAALGMAFGGWQLDIGWRSFGWLLLLAMTSQTAGWLLITSSLPRLPAALSSLLLLLQPAASILLAAVVLGERPTVLQLTGAVLVCAGVLAASRAATRSRTRPAPPATLAPPTSPAPPASPVSRGGGVTGRSSRSRPRAPAHRPAAAGAGSPDQRAADPTGTAPVRPPRP
jgi:drug/metabolite transporter (DMT)-like permease